MSIITKSRLNSNHKVIKEKIPLKSCGGNPLPVKGHTSISLSVDGQQFPKHHFWVTPIQFDKFAGIIGTDILSNIGAVINCSEKALHWTDNLQRTSKIPLSYVHHLDGEAKIANLTPCVNKKLSCKSVQLVPIADVSIPSNHASVVLAKFRSPLQLNQDYEIESSVLHKDGVIIGRAIVRPWETGCVPVPILNITDKPFLIKANYLLSLAFPASPRVGATAPVSPGDLGDNRQPDSGNSEGEKQISIPIIQIQREGPEESSETPKTTEAMGSEERGEKQRTSEQEKEEDEQSACNPGTSPEQTEGILSHLSTDSPGVSRDQDPQQQLQPAESEQTEEGETPVMERQRDSDQEEPITDYDQQEKISTAVNFSQVEQSVTTTSEQHLDPAEWTAQAWEIQRNHVQKLEEQLPDVTTLLPNPNIVPYRRSRKQNTPEAPLHQRIKRDVSYLATPGDGAELADNLKEIALQAQVPPEYKGEFLKLIYAYQDIFCEDGDPTPSCPLFEQEIKLDTNIPICQRQYPLPKASREALKERVTEFLEAGVVKPSISPYNSPIWPVEKPDGSYRVCVDFRKLNEHILPDPFPMPKIEEILEEFHQMRYFSSLDLYWGFYQVKVKPQDTHKLAFTTSEGRFEFLNLPMGLRLSPAVFQRLMNMVFTDHLNKTLMIYMDDIIVYSPDAKSHLEHLELAFRRLQKAGLHLKAKKCQIFKTEMKFLGFIISGEGTRLDPEKIEAVQKFPIPKDDLGQLQSFLGMVGYFKRHIKDYARIARPLYQMFKGEDTHTKKRKGKVRTVFKKNEWGPAQDAAVQQLKDAATSAPVLVYPDFTKPFILTTDASQYALGFVLSQERETGEHPVAYGSRLLKGAERNYGNHDREWLAIISGIRHFRSYLYGRYFKVRTDHQAIPLIHKGKAMSQRVCKWLLETEGYHFDVEYTPATKIRHADALSRVRWDLLEEKQERNEESSPIGRNINAVSQAEATISASEENDEDTSDRAIAPEGELPDYQPVIDIYEWGKQQKQDPELREKMRWVEQTNPPDYAIHNDTLYQLIRPEDGFVPVAPRVYQKRILAQFHGPPFVGHQGPERTYKSMRRYVYWRGMRKDVEEFIDRCDACQRHKRSYLRIPMQNQVIPPLPFHTVSMDVVGPLPVTEFGEEYLLVIQDMLTRWVELAPMRTTDTKTILSRFENYWIKRYGYPQRLLTDRASVFVGREMAEFCDFFGIEKIHTTAYRPEGNGANERSHQELTKYFSMYLEHQNKNKWRWLLPNAMYVLNTTDHSALGMSPYQALFAFVPPLGALGYPRKESEDQTKFEEYYGLHRDQLLEVRKRAAEMLQDAQNKVIQRYNQHSHQIPFKIGDYVLYKNHTPKTKFDPKYTGPWKIIGQISRTVFELAMGKYRFSAHAVYLKPYHGHVIEEPEEEAPAEVDEERLMPVVYEDEQDILDDGTQQQEDLTSDDEELGPRSRAERFRNIGSNIRRKLFKTLPQIRPSPVLSSAPIPFRIPNSEVSPGFDTPLRRGIRDRRQPDRLTYR